MASFLEKLEGEAFRSGVTPRTRKSLEWFRKRVENIARVNRAELLKDELLKSSKGVTIGSMFLYRYEAKHHATLPYWDRYPLIFMVGPAEGGWHGINLHYLPPILRAKLFDELMKIRTNKRYDSTTKLRLSYGVLKNSSQFAEFAPCFKHYLKEQLRSKPIYVPPTEWEVVLFLPFDQFVKKKRDYVWDQSKRMIREARR